MSRVTEVAAKLGRLLEALDSAGAKAIRLRSSAWFAWVTGGGSNVVLLASETGVAEVLVTREGAFVLTDEIEAQRLRDEEIVGPFEVWAHPWADPGARERKVRELSEGGRVLSDRPERDEEGIPDDIREMRWTLLDGEVERYRAVGRDAAQAMTEALQGAQPDWTEAQLAAAGAAALLRRGLEPALVLAAGERRGELYRHFTVKDEPLGAWGALVFCGRRHGLYANLTRYVSFGPLDQDHREKHRRLLHVESRLWQATKPGARLDDVYRAAEAAYVDIGARRAITEHHQGGVTGYAARERVANPHTSEVLMPTIALAWNPSLPGAKLEDTVLLNSDGTLEAITTDPAWPTVTAEHGARPAVLELP